MLVRPDQFNVLLLGFSQLKTGATDRFFFNLQAWYLTKDCIIRMKGSIYKIINEKYKKLFCSVYKCYACSSFELSFFAACTLLGDRVLASLPA